MPAKLDTKIDLIRKEGKYLKGCDGNLIWYRYHKGDGVPTVFIHGLSGSSFPFEKFYDYFKKHNKSVIIYDQRGHGFSEKTVKENYSIDAFAKDLKSILSKLKIDKANLVGHCFGGIVLFESYRNFPEMVESLTIIGSDYNPNENILNQLFREILLETEDSVKSKLYRFYNSKHRNEIDYGKFLIDGDWYVPRMLEDFEETSLKVMYKVLENILALNYTEMLPSIQVPTFIIHGRFDTVFGVGNAKQMKHLIRNSKLKILNENHVSLVLRKKTILPEIVYSNLIKNKLV